jgi:hypothetical protein
MNGPELAVKQRRSMPRIVNRPDRKHGEASPGLELAQIEGQNEAVGLSAATVSACRVPPLLAAPVVAAVVVTV